MGKIADFLEKHGYTYKSFGLAVLIFPPAAIVVAWKRPATSLAIRIALTVAALIPMLAVPLGGLALIQSLIG